ncbi:MAG: lysophospholipid acyltransferase family protein [Actinomycetes bacterium]
MADARVIPIDGGDRPRRTTKTSSAADAVAAGASRASGERARRRTATPLLSGADDATPPPDTRPRPRRPRKTTAKSSPTTRATASQQRTARGKGPGGGHGEVPEGRRPQAPETETVDAAARVAPGTADAADAAAAASAPAPTAGSPHDWETKVAGALAFVRRRITGEWEVDEFGFDPELTDNVLLAMMRPLYDHYFRVEVRGLENVPAEGGALVVANHSGTIPLDSVMTQIALREHHPARRHLRMLGADLVFQTPFVGEIARKTGTTLACNADAERLLAKGELVGVWPEGFKGIGKPFSERYKLQRFGRGGFVSAALRSQVPIVPCSIVGAEEIYPILGNMKTLARLLGLPYVPVTPTFPWLGPLGMIPLPSKWIIEFGEPIPTADHGSAAADDPMLVFNLTDQVRETIQHTLYRLLMARRSVFF